MITKEEATKMFEATREERRQEYIDNTINFCDNFLSEKIKERAKSGYRSYSFSISEVPSIVGNNEVYDVKTNIPNRILLSKLKDTLVKSGYDFCPSNCRYSVTVNW
jgi:hypothetical protein